MDTPLPGPPLAPPQVSFADGRKTIVALDFTLDQGATDHDPASTARALHAVEVYADTVRIPHDLSLPGRDLKIVARLVEVAEGVTIDTSGGAPEASFAPGHPATQLARDAAADGTGATGTAGAAGSPGMDGGHVSIHADAFAVVPAGGRALPAEPDATDGVPAFVDAVMLHALRAAAWDPLHFKNEVFTYRPPWSLGELRATVSAHLGDIDARKLRVGTRVESAGAFTTSVDLPAGRFFLQARTSGVPEAPPMRRTDVVT